MEWRWQRRLISELKAIEIIQTATESKQTKKNGQSLNGVRDHKKKVHIVVIGVVKGGKKAVNPV